MIGKTSVKNLNRDDLKKFFRNGQMPSENHFGYLIDSMINKQDDGFRHDDDEGLVLSSSLRKRFVTLYKSMDDRNPFFSMGADDKDEQDNQSLRFTSLTGSATEAAAQSFFLHANGNMGVGKKSEKEYKVDVNGFVAAQGRVGTYIQDSVPADGKWHYITPDLDNCSAFELIARTGRRTTGRFAILHAIALSAFGRSRSRIRKTSAHYGSFWNKITVRWKSTGTHHYRLQLKTRRNYGDGVLIFFKIGKLWDDELFMPAEYFY
ncbi:hypothetical protein QTN47_05045 [Danxiaibacter flavus]|uniref:Adhesin n=1 Tax=Danxiaibacter flavus TaxID=3049108 RepID=A0ABV3ZAG1_9BACT|nr:hypothetical protein QNM32_05045 [Chitinophagaceae bacterium DXS]